ncbi:MAG TPA: peptidylprolyl isomerase [Pyrinomonadaceae bacterium]|nr:peptidylprolyl isomerase [Pyrinomonadaceae bacterium]
MNSRRQRHAVKTPSIFRLTLTAFLFTNAVLAIGQNRLSSPWKELVPRSVQLQILQAEDKRQWDETLSKLLSDPNASVRARVALAAGRIGSDQAVTPLSSLLKDDKEEGVRAMAAFAIGEIEAASGALPLIEASRNRKETPEVRRRAIEGIGKIAAALPREQEARARELGAIVLENLRVEGERSAPDSETILLGLTAALRSRPPNAGPVIADFLHHADSRVRADAANVLARLRLKDANKDLALLLTSDLDPIVRANAARVLGATEEKSASATLLDRALNDSDSRVRVSSIRALATVKDPNAAEPLLQRAVTLLDEQRKQQKAGTKNPPVQNELLELATTLGRLLPLQAEQNQIVYAFFLNLGELVQPFAPEIETAYVRVLPETYLSKYGSEVAARQPQPLHWRSAVSIAQALREVATLPNTVPNHNELKAKAGLLLRDLLDNSSGKLTVMKNLHPEYAIPEILRALAAFKPNDLGDLALKYLSHEDVVVRSTAADLIGDLPPSDANTRSLITALAQTKSDALNDAALSILDSLGKQKTSAANEGIKSALQSADPLIRQRAVALLKTNGVGDFAASIGTVKTSNTKVDYLRALSRSDRSVRAIVTTSKGSFTIELLPSEAPLTVDNFIRLAQRGYFRGITIHRVVPNFVIQDGDPRGDGNGGPGYQIRCEINQLPYERASVGMALSGKDTGGSQWFVTHSRQPHLDGGYTIFGRVMSGMDVVDNIVRGDVIQSITIREK